MPVVSLSLIDFVAAGRRFGLVGSVLVVSAMPALADVTSQAKRTENNDGSTSMVFSNEVADLGTKVGINVTKPATDPMVDPVAGQEGYSGAAFAHVTAKRLPDWMIWRKGTVDVTINPADESSKVETTFSRTVTLNDGVKATVSDSYALERSNEGKSWETDKSLSVKLVETATTFSLATKTTDDAERWMPSVSASQELAEGLSVTTSIADTGSDLDKSVTASFKHRW